MKKGDKVYAAFVDFGGVAVDEATVAGVYTRGRVKLATRESAWNYRSLVPESQCHGTRRAALEALLADENVSLDVARDRCAEIAAALAKEPTP